jgi:hypothetical protein
VVEHGPPRAFTMMTELHHTACSGHHWSEREKICCHALSGILMRVASCIRGETREFMGWCLKKGCSKRVCLDCSDGVGTTWPRPRPQPRGRLLVKTQWDHPAMLSESPFTHHKQASNLRFRCNGTPKDHSIATRSGNSRARLVDLRSCLRFHAGLPAA